MSSNRPNPVDSHERLVADTVDRADEVRAAIGRERERCALIADQYGTGSRHVAQKIARRIRQGSPESMTYTGGNR